MTYADVIGQMQRIQAQVALFTPQRATAATGTSGSGAAFTTALARASARTDVAPSAAASTAVAATTGAAATTAVDGTTIDENGVTGDDVVQAALQYKGVPYVLGGESKSGIDCSALVQSAFKDLGVSVPRLVHEQQTVGQEVDSLKDAKPGDLIVLNGGDHIAIYMGNDTVIHAPYAGRTVSVQKAWFTDADITSIRRVVPATGDGTTSTAATTAATAADSSSTTSSGLSAATVARATALLAMFGGSGTSGDSTSSDQSLSSLLSSFGITGTSGSTTDATGTAAAAAGFLGSAGTTGATTSSTTTQQLIAARAAMYGTSS